jgi:L-alanine-DL-glutamate epimerase-like enolase superfamily enzyme
MRRCEIGSSCGSAPIRADCSAGTKATLEWKTRSVVSVIDYLASLIRGRASRDIEKLVRMMRKHSFWRLGVIGMSAVSGIQLALWDIFGKSRDQRAWRLLGGQLATACGSIPISASAICARPMRGL